MSLKPPLHEHHLFNNRQRILAVPTKTQAHPKNPLANQVRSMMLSFVLGLLIFFIFLAGFCLNNPVNTQLVGNIFGIAGERWQGFLEGWLGATVGPGLAEKSPWVLARAGGVLAYLLLFASVTLGLCVSLRLTDRFIRRAAIVYLHKLLSLVMLTFIVLHLAGLMLDHYLKFSLYQSLLPFNATYRPFWTGLGSLALYGAIALVSSFYLAEILGSKLWRAIHYGSLAVFVVALLHGIMAGTDSKASWMQVIYGGSGLVVAILLGLRLYRVISQRFRTI